MSWREYDYARYERVLTAAFTSGERLYSAAYVVPPPAFGEARKHANHLRLLELMMSTDVAGKVRSAGSLRGAFEVLRSYPAIGDFLAYQYVIDLNYSPVLAYDEMEFVVPGPGARDGIRKCFGRAADGIEADVIRYMADHQEEHFARLGLHFGGLRGRRLQLIDCQNLFCEVDKYARVAHPDVQGISGRTRIKQSFRPVAEPVPAWFPPKWGINRGLTKPSPRNWPTVAHLYDTEIRIYGLYAHQLEKGGSSVNPVKDRSPDSADLVAVLATTLERLTARVSRDLDVDAGESVLPDDPFWADTISRLAEYARECAEVLDEPRVTAVLTAHPDGPLPAAPAGHLLLGGFSQAGDPVSRCTVDGGDASHDRQLPGMQAAVAHTYPSSWPRPR